MNQPETTEQKERRWRNTRRMSWICLLAAIFYPGFVYFAGGDQFFIDLATPFYLFNFSVVGFYIGFSTAEDKFKVFKDKL